MLDLNISENQDFLENYFRRIKVYRCVKQKKIFGLAPLFNP